jgi:hypothetical protein
MPRPSYRRLLKWVLFSVFLSVGAGTLFGASESNREIALAPAPERHHGAVVQIYAARTWGKKGMVAVHTWIVSKRSGAQTYTRYEIFGWQLRHSSDALRVGAWFGETGWWGNPGTLLLDRRGADADRLIDKIEMAVSEYPYKSEYRLWPGPNSNTFTAYIGLAVPELRLDLPSTAVGKDYRPLSKIIGRSPSGTGVQISLLGLLSFSLGLEEGLELNLLGANFEWDVFDLAIELPAIGRIGQPQVRTPLG